MIVRLSMTPWVSCSQRNILEQYSLHKHGWDIVGSQATAKRWKHLGLSCPGRRFWWWRILSRIYTRFNGTEVPSGTNLYDFGSKGEIPRNCDVPIIDLGIEKTASPPLQTKSSAAVVTMYVYYDSCKVPKSHVILFVTGMNRWTRFLLSICDLKRNHCQRNRLGKIIGRKILCSAWL